MNVANIQTKELCKAVTQATAGSVDETSVDLLGTVNPGGRNMKAAVSVKYVSGTGVTMNAKIQESDSAATGFTDISGAAITQLTDASGYEEIIFKTNKRYVRLNHTTAGGAQSWVISAVLITEKRIA